MQKFAANLTMMYTELPFLQRFEAAAGDGFKAVEFAFPYAWPKEELLDGLKAHHLQLVLFNAPPGGMDAEGIAQAVEAGDKGTACIPGREREFRAGVALAIDFALALNCPRIHLMAGIVPRGADPIQVRATYVNNLRWASIKAAQAGRDVLIEPINTRDIPGFYLNRQDHAHEILAEVGSPNLKVQMDLYHCQIVEGDVAMKLRKYLPTGKVGHIQIAGVPQRHEPDVGELHFPYLFSVLDELGYEGWVGCEYRPQRGGQMGGTSSGLGWLRPYL